MRNLKLKILGIVAFGLLTLSGLSYSSCWTCVSETQYRFERILLPDNTPCYIVKGGTHSGLIGITCNYNARAGVR